MRIAYLDCFSGISGDMFLGALVDAGVDPELFRRTIKALGIDAEIRVHRVDRRTISATKVDVIEGQKHGHPQEQHSGHDHAHGRSIEEIRAILRSADIDQSARRTALETFELLGNAEAQIHNLPVEKLHFHEVGAVDAIVDITCTAVGCQALAAERWVCSPLNVGSGTVECAHGTFPVPAPATLVLLKGAPVYSSGIQAELVTPTGAALLRALGVEFGAMPPMRTSASGYGAGARDLPARPNVLRLTVGESAEEVVSDLPSERVAILETAVDDLSPQVIGYVIDRALREGALDAMCTPAQMKKNRPGHLLTVLCRPEDQARMRDLLLCETTTLGVRVREEQRFCLEREVVEVHTRWGDARVKCAFRGNSLVNCAPEYEDCRRIAEEKQVPLKAVMKEVLRCYDEMRRRGAESSR